MKRTFLHQCGIPVHPGGSVKRGRIGRGGKKEWVFTQSARFSPHFRFDGQ